MLFILELEVRKVLHPGTGVYHASIALACLWLGLVTKHREAFQCIGRSRYLCRCGAITPVLLGWTFCFSNKPAENTAGNLQLFLGLVVLQD